MDTRDGIYFLFLYLEQVFLVFSFSKYSQTTWRFDKLGSDAPGDASAGEAVGLPEQYSP